MWTLKETSILPTQSLPIPDSNRSTQAAVKEKCSSMGLASTYENLVD